MLFPLRSINNTFKQATRHESDAALCQGSGKREAVSLRLFAAPATATDLRRTPAQSHTDRVRAAACVLVCYVSTLGPQEADKVPPRRFSETFKFPRWALQARYGSRVFRPKL